MDLAKDRFLVLQQQVIVTCCKKFSVRIGFETTVVLLFQQVFLCKSKVVIGGGAVLKESLKITRDKQLKLPGVGFHRKNTTVLAVDSDQERCFNVY